MPTAGGLLGGMPDLKRPKRLEPQFAMEGNGIGVRGWTTDHPTADLVIAELKSGLQQCPLHGSRAVLRCMANLQRPMQGPAAAPAVGRMGHNSRQRAL